MPLHSLVIWVLIEVKQDHGECEIRDVAYNVL